MAVETPQTSPAGAGRMRWLDALVILYGILLIVMAVDGYLHGSLPSLISGGIAGLLEVGFAALTVTNPRIGRIGSAVIALLILGRFLPAYFFKKDQTVSQHTSALILWVSSLVVFCCLMGGHFYAMSKRKASQAA